MTTTRVAKKGTPDANGGVYIGRGSPFGNPFHIGITTATTEWGPA